jgi:hypothetical protein
MNRPYAVNTNMHAAPGTEITTRHIIVNALLFQLCWFTAVLAGGYWAILPVVLMLLHYLAVKGRAAIPQVLILTCFGVVFDSLYLYLNVYEFQRGAALPLLGLPVWLCCLWLAFCLCLPVSLAWLVKKIYVFMLACALLGPLSYVAGRQAGAIQFMNEEIAFLVMQWIIFAFLAGTLLRGQLIFHSER